MDTFILRVGLEEDVEANGAEEAKAQHLLYDVELFVDRAVAAAAWLYAGPGSLRPTLAGGIS